MLLRRLNLPVMGERLRAASVAGEEEETAHLGRLRWVAVLLPTLCIGLFEFLRHQWLVGVLPMWLGHGWVGNVLGALVVAAVVYFSSGSSPVWSERQPWKRLGPARRPPCSRNDSASGARCTTASRRPCSTCGPS